MNHHKIFEYYKKLIFSSSALVLSLSLGFVTLVFFGVVLKQSLETNSVNDRNRLILADQIIDSLRNTYTMIGNSSHSIIALKYGDYAGYRRVVFPWIQGDPRIKGVILKDKGGATKLEWTKSGQQINFPDISVSDHIQLVDRLLAHKMALSDGGESLGSITFYSDLAESGLENLGVGATQLLTPTCTSLKNIELAQICPSTLNTSKFLAIIFSYVLLCALIIFLVLRSLISKLGSRLKTPIEALHLGLSEIQQGKSVVWEDLLPVDSQSVFMPLGSHISKAANDYQELKGKVIVNEHLAAMAEQVAHDIRSPLSALTMVMGTLKDLPEDRRILIRNAAQRINDIANDLLRKGKNIQIQKSTANDLSVVSKEKGEAEFAIDFIPALIDILVSEKRMQFREFSGIEIEIDLKDSFGSFSKINSGELKRVISNLINNSVEAFENKTGRLQIGVRKMAASKQVEISIADNGKGIPEHILKKIGERGVSSGKENTTSGSGLGVFHAKQTIKSFGGDFLIESKTGQGTTIRILLPLGESPPWFAERIELTGKSILVSLDDDVTIHQIWSERLQSMALSEKIDHMRFSSGDLFSRYVLSNLTSRTDTLFVVDFELLNQPKTGLDLIEELGIANHAVLATSRYEEKKIQDRAAKIGLKLLPKSLAGFVPILLSQPKKKPDYVLVDDDSLIHMTWKMAAQERGKSILCFFSGDELKSALNDIDPQSAFFIDANLSNNEKGELVARDLFELGCKNLYLATGFEVDHFENVPWIKGIVGKKLPEL